MCTASINLEFLRFLKFIRLRSEANTILLEETVANWCTALQKKARSKNAQEGKQLKVFLNSILLISLYLNRNGIQQTDMKPFFSEHIITADDIKTYFCSERGRKAIKCFGQTAEGVLSNQDSTSFIAMRNFLMVMISLSNAPKAGALRSLTHEIFDRRVQQTSNTFILTVGIENTTYFTLFKYF